jgi:glycosyltransferase involved in cell wall biosynthesis
MRILHVTQGYYPAIGGTERLIQRLSEELVRGFGDEVTVFTTDCYNGDAFYTPALPAMPSGWSELNGVRIRRFPVRRRVSRALRRPQALAYRFGLPFNEHLRALAGGPIVPGLREAIESCAADVIVAASFPLLHMFDAAAAARASGRPSVLIGCLHPLDDWASGRPRIYRAIRDADAYIALTSYEADYVIARGAKAAQVHTVGVGVDVEPGEGLSGDEGKWRLGFDRRPLIGFIGQLGGHKGLDTLLRAMPRVWRVRPDVNLLVAGGRTLFAAEAERIMQSWPADFRRRSRLWVGFPEERKAWLFAALDLLAYPSGYESFGIAYLEAWVAGKPVIGVRRGAVPAVIDEGIDGVLIDYQDDEALAGAILELLDDPVRARRLGEAGRAKVATRYTWPHVARQYREVYSSVARAGGTGSAGGAGGVGGPGHG